MGTYTDYVSVFTAVSVDWVEVNNTPYLQNTTTDYVDTATRNILEGWFNFAASGDPGTNVIDSVVLYIETQQDAGGDDQIEINLQATGVASASIGTITPNAGGYTFQTIDVSATLNTWTKIDSAGILLTSRRVGGTMTTVYARRAYLLVTYHAPPTWTYAGRRTQDQTTRHNRRSGSLQYVRFPTGPY